MEGLSDSVVRLRPPADADVERIAEYCRDPEIARYTRLPSPYEPRHAREWRQRSDAGIAAGTEIGAVVVDAGSGELLGSVGMGLDPETSRASAGYWVAAPARGRGIASRALKLLARFAFDELCVERIELWIEPANAPSLRVAEAVGFHREGLLRSFMPIHGVRHDMLMYSLLPIDLR